MLKISKEIFNWAKNVEVILEDIGVIYCKGMEVKLRYGGWGHPLRNKGFYNEKDPQPGYWSRLFLVDKDRTFLYLVGYKYMSPMNVIHISRPEELAEFSEDYVRKLHFYCLGDDTHE